MKVSKVVLIVVALHVLVIGGIFVFEGCSRAKAPAPDFAANETAPADAANQPALPADPTAQPTLLPAQPVVATPTPLTPVTPVAPAPVTTKTYAVKSGDSLWKISKAEGVSVGDLAKANNLTKTSVLKIGQKLTIPAKAEAALAPTQVAATAPTATGLSADTTTMLAPTSVIPAGANTYTVKSGDSLWKIAKSQGVSVAALKQANSLSTDALKVGQKLAIPAKTDAAVMTTASATTTTGEWTPGPVQENGQMFHIVDIGESPATIAKKHGIKVEDLMRANNITDARRIRVGDRLTIPVAAAATSASAPVPATPAVAAPFVTSLN
jgi:LysM repeat protein